MDNNHGVGEALRIRKFEVGDLVFAKLKGYAPWPSKINQIESIISGGQEKTRYNVYFYGTHQSSILRSSSLFHYDTHAKSIVDKWGRRPKFHDALKELEREMMDKMTYLNQLRTATPDSLWSHGFNSACENLVHEIDGAHHKTKSKNHCKPTSVYSPIVHEIHEVEDDVEEESRKLGYEVMYMERIPFPDTPESLIVLSLNFNKDWVMEEAKKIKEEERMKNCFVRIEPLPPQYAHLVQKQNGVSIDHSNGLDWDSRIETNRQNARGILKDPKQEIKSFNIKGWDVSDGSDEEAVETCPVCRLCFFSQDDLKNHELSVHGSISTAESLFDQLLYTNRVTENHSLSVSKEELDETWQRGYSIDSIV